MDASVELCEYLEARSTKFRLLADLCDPSNLRNSGWIFDEIFRQVTSLLPSHLADKSELPFTFQPSHVSNRNSNGAIVATLRIFSDNTAVNCLASFKIRFADQVYVSKVDNHSPKNIRKRALSAGNKARVLIVDDSRLNRMVFSKYLNDYYANLDIVLAENGKLAVEYFRDDHTLCLILMDKQMPVMDGIEATKQIREFERGDQRPIIIAITASKEKLPDIFDGVLHKPVNSEELLGVIDSFCVERRLSLVHKASRSSAKNIRLSPDIKPKLNALEEEQLDMTVSESSSPVKQRVISGNISGQFYSKPPMQPQLPEKIVFSELQEESEEVSDEEKPDDENVHKSFLG